MDNLHPGTPKVENLPVLEFAVDRGGMQVDAGDEGLTDSLPVKIGETVIFQEIRKGPGPGGVQGMHPHFRVGKMIIAEDMIFMEMGIDDNIDRGLQQFLDVFIATSGIHKDPLIVFDQQAMAVGETGLVGSLDEIDVIGDLDHFLHPSLYCHLIKTIPISLYNDNYKREVPCINSPLSNKTPWLTGRRPGPANRTTRTAFTVRTVFPS
jgi:hypothetical protein